MSTVIQPAINKHPRGLLDFFGIKSQGRYPGVMAEFVQPSLDLVMWYASLNAEHLAFSRAAGTFDTTAAGAFYNWDLSPAQFIDAGTGSVTVPPNEAWFVLNFHMTAGIVSATDSVAVAHAFLPKGLPTAPWIPSQDYTPTRVGGAAAPASALVSAVLNEPVFLGPGTILTVQSYGVTKPVGSQMLGGMRVCRFLV